MEDDLNPIVGVLRTTTLRWSSLAESIPAGLFLRRPLKDEWSAMECLQHELDTEELFQTRLKCFLSGQDLAAFYPDEQGRKLAEAATPVSLAAEFASMRAESLIRLEALHPADLDRSARHSELGRVTLREMLNEWAGHDLIHLLQAERAVLQPFIYGCGAWRVYFEEHLAG